MAFSQFLLIWAGNLPDETPYYLKRMRGGWEWIGLALIVLHFAVPFVMLLFRDVKENQSALLGVAVGVLVMRLRGCAVVDRTGLPAQRSALYWLLDVAAFVAPRRPLAVVVHRPAATHLAGTDPRSEPVRNGGRPCVMSCLRRKNRSGPDTRRATSMSRSSSPQRSFWPVPGALLGLLLWEVSLPGCAGTKGGGRIASGPDARRAGGRAIASGPSRRRDSTRWIRCAANQHPEDRCGARRSSEDLRVSRLMDGWRRERSPGSRLIGPWTRWSRRSGRRPCEEGRREMKPSLAHLVVPRWRRWAAAIAARLSRATGPPPPPPPASASTSGSARRSRSICPSRTRPATRHARRLHRRQADDSRAGLLPLPDALHARCSTACSARLRAMPSRCGKHLQRRGGQLRPAREAAARGGQEGDLRGASTAGPDAEAGWHFLTGDPLAIASLADAVGLPLPVRPGHRAVRPRQRADRSRPRRHDLALPARRPVRAARPAPGASGGVRGQGRLAVRSGLAPVLPLRPGDRRSTRSRSSGSSGCAERDRRPRRGRDWWVFLAWKGRRRWSARPPRDRGGLSSGTASSDIGIAWRCPSSPSRRPSTPGRWTTCSSSSSPSPARSGCWSPLLLVVFAAALPPPDGRRPDPAHHGLAAIGVGLDRRADPAFSRSCSAGA